MEDNIIKRAKENSASMISRLTPIIDQLSVLRIKKDMLPAHGVELQKEALREVEACYLDLICQITGIDRKDI